MLLAILLALDIESAQNPCSGKGDALVVDAKRHVMWLCESGRRTGTHRVALGQGGLGKRLEGDAKVPLGEYSLAQPVSSKDYHLFVPVGYPTRRQRDAGYTGSAIGVHGPPRCCKGPSSTDTDWTLGCIAVGTDEEIERIAEWLKTRHVGRIVIQAE